jgi:hypothetical protein
MVNVDEVAFFKTRKQRAADAVAFEQDDRIVRGDGIGPNDVIGEREVVINTWDPVMHDDFGILAHDAQDLATGKGRSDAVAVGPGVRGHDETAARPNFL